MRLAAMVLAVWAAASCVHVTPAAPPADTQPEAAVSVALAPDAAVTAPASTVLHAPDAATGGQPTPASYAPASLTMDAASRCPDPMLVVVHPQLGTVVRSTTAEWAAPDDAAPVPPAVTLRVALAHRPGAVDAARECVFAVPAHGFAIVYDARSKSPPAANVTADNYAAVAQEFSLQPLGGGHLGVDLKQVIPGFQVLVLKLYRLYPAPLAHELDGYSTNPPPVTGVRLVDTAYIMFTALAWDQDGANAMLYRPDLHTFFMSDVASGVAPHAADTLLGTGSKPASSLPPPPPPPTITVVFIGDAVSFDGMKVHIAEQVRRYRGFAVKAIYMNTVCGSDDGTTMPFLAAAGAEVIHMCISVPRSTCADSVSFYQFAAHVLPRVRSYSDLPGPLQESLHEIAEVFRRADSLTIGLYWPTDLYFLVLARLANPKLVQLVDLGSTYTFPLPQPDDYSWDWSAANVHDTNHTIRCLYPDLDALRPPQRPSQSDEFPFLPFPADMLVPPSQWVRNQPAVVGTGIPARAVYPFVDTALYDPALVSCDAVAAWGDAAHADAMTARQAAGQTVVLGTAGRLAPEKNIGMLVEAFAHLWHRRRNVTDRGAGPDVVLLVVGKPCNPEYMAGMHDLVRRLGIPRVTVRFTGFVAPSSVPALLKCMDVYVCPSIKETFGIAAVQAMSMALPVVHYGAGGLQDYTVEGVNGVRATPFTAAALADAVESLVDDSATRRHMSVQARQFALRHLSTLPLGPLSAKTYRTTVAEKRLDFATRITATHTPATNRTHTPPALRVASVATRRPVSSVCRSTVPELLRSVPDGADVVASLSRGTPRDAPTAQLAVTVADVASAFEVFGVDPGYVLDAYRLVVAGLYQPDDASAARRRLAAYRHANSTLCFELCALDPATRLRTVAKLNRVEAMCVPAGEVLSVPPPAASAGNDSGNGLVLGVRHVVWPQAWASRELGTAAVIMAWLAHAQTPLTDVQPVGVFSARV